MRANCQSFEITNHLKLQIIWSCQSFEITNHLKLPITQSCKSFEFESAKISFEIVTCLKLQIIWNCQSFEIANHLKLPIIWSSSWALLSCILFRFIWMTYFKRVFFFFLRIMKIISKCVITCIDSVYIIYMNSWSYKWGSFMISYIISKTHHLPNARGGV